jgi:hypothetical protein
MPFIFVIYIFSACSDGIMRGRRGEWYPLFSDCRESKANTITFCLPKANDRAFRRTEDSLTHLKVSQNHYSFDSAPPTHKAGEKFGYKLLHKTTPFVEHCAPLCSDGCAFTASCEFINSLFMPLIIFNFMCNIIFYVACVFLCDFRKIYRFGQEKSPTGNA